MQIKFNRTGAERKALVAAMGEILEAKPQYLGAPGFAYSVGPYTIDKEGALEGDACEAAFASLLEALAQRGFLPEGTPAPDVAAEEVVAVELPDAGFHYTAAENLKRLIAGKAPLIRAALGGDLAESAYALPVIFAEDKVRFPWFRPGMDADTTDAWMRFVCALCETAKKQKRVILTEKAYDGSEKYAMRCFLLKLNFIGDEYKAARKVILANLSGNGSFKSGEGKKQAAETTAALGDCLSCGRSISEPGEDESGPDRLFCVERQAYVSEDGCCPEYN